MDNAIQQLKRLNARGQIRPTDRIHVGEVVNLLELARRNFKPFQYYIPYKRRSGHVGCLGATRVGKTRLLEHFAVQDIRAGNNVVAVDPKFDVDLLSKIIQTAAECGRLDDFMFISPIFSEYSLKIDPLAYYYMRDELVDHVVSGIKAKEEYFINVATEITTSIIAGLIAMAKAKGQKPNLSFYDIKTKVDYNELKKFRESLEMLKNNPDKEVRQLVDEALVNIDQVLNSPQDFFSKVSSTLRTTLTSLTSSTTGQIIGKAHTNEFVKRFEEGKRVILYCNTGVLLARKTAHIIGRVLISMIQSMVGRFFSSGREISPPLCLYIDEAHNTLYRGIEDLFNKAGGAGVWIHFFTQSLAQVIEEVGQETAQSIVDNIHTWIIMRVGHNDTAQIMEDFSPLQKINEPFLHLDSGNISVSIRKNEKRLILREDVLQLKDRWFYMKSPEGYFKGHIPFVPPSKLKVIFPEISGISQTG